MPISVASYAAPDTKTTLFAHRKKCGESSGWGERSGGLGAGWGVAAGIEQVWLVDMVGWVGRVENADIKCLTRMYERTSVRGTIHKVLGHLS